MVVRRPAEAFSPGEILKDELDARGWTQAELADITGRHATAISDIIAGKRGITAETAKALAAAFGSSPEFWMNLDSAYQLSRLHNNDERTISQRAKLYSTVPVKEIVRRGWIEPSDNVDVLESRICRFLGIDDINQEPDDFPHAARKSTSYDQELTPSQKVWLRRARQIARGVSSAPFTEKGLDVAIEKLHQLMHVPQEVRNVPRVLSEAGVKLVIVQPLTGSRIDGACFMLDGSPVIVLSLRFDRIDNFWFVLLHELGHIRQGHLREEPFMIDIDLEQPRTDEVSKTTSKKDENEREANSFATEHLVPQKRLEGFIARIQPLYSARKIEAFAQTIGVHPAIVVGQLQHRKEIAYSSFRKMMVPIREWITSSALTDGYGAVLPPEF